MRHAAFATALALMAGGLACAQTPAETFESGLAEYRRAHQIPSLSVLVLRDGEAEVEAYLGWSDDEGEVATSADTTYFTASVTKTVTGTTLFLADQAGEIDLDRPMADAEDWRGPIQQRFLRSRANTIEGGTSEVMRNILAERVLGLPGDLRADAGMPWKEVPRG